MGRIITDVALQFSKIIMGLVINWLRIRMWG